MNVSLTSELEKFIHEEVKSGLYQTASEVVRAGLRRLREDKLRVPRTPRNRAELEREMLASVQRLERGEGIHGEAAYKRWRQRQKERRGNG